MKFILVLLLLISSFARALASDFKAAVLDVEPLYIRDGSNTKGFHYDTLKAMEAETGKSFAIEPVSRDRAADLIKNREIDLLIMFDSESTDKIQTKKIYLGSTNLVIFTLKSSPSTLGQLKGRIGRLQGGCQDIKLKNVNFYEIKDYEHGLNLLRKKRIEGLCGSIEAIFYALEKSGLEQDDLNKIVISNKIIWVHTHPQIDPKKFSLLKTTTEKLIKNGTIERLDKKYRMMN